VQLYIMMWAGGRSYFIIGSIFGPGLPELFYTFIPALHRDIA
jgi:hypothetical protein